MTDTDRISMTSPNRRIRRYFVLVVAVSAGLYVAQKYQQPEVDESLTRSVVISATPRTSLTGKSNSGSTNTDPSSIETASLPPDCITAGIDQSTFESADHPLDPLLEVARDALQEIDKKVQDYTCTMISHVFADDKLQDERFLFCKIRHQQKQDDGTETPFGVYTRFLKPKSHVGQEAIWVAGQNDGNLIAHVSGMLNVKRFYLDPDGRQAMAGNRYPIRDIGFRNLVVKMIEFGERDRAYDECEVRLTRNVQINDRTCSLIEVSHPIPRPHFEFHLSKIYIDDQWNVPIAYEGYSWPESGEKSGEESAGKLPLLEKYYYTDIQFNVGLTDEDFDPANKEYNYPQW